MICQNVGGDAAVYPPSNLLFIVLINLIIGIFTQRRKTNTTSPACYIAVTNFLIKTYYSFIKMTIYPANLASFF
jgi:hypothetical protein